MNYEVEFIKISPVFTCVKKFKNRNSFFLDSEMIRYRRACHMVGYGSRSSGIRASASSTDFLKFIHVLKNNFS